MTTQIEADAPAVERLEISHFQGFRGGSLISVRSSQSRTIGGYAAVFGKPSQNLGGFHERVHPKAFNKSRSDGWPDVICRFNHKDDFLLGTTRSSTLQLSVDNLGLEYQVDLPECRSDILEMTARGDLAHSSFAFLTYDDEWATNDGGYPMRLLLSCRLIDVAPVTTPAYPDATVGLRSLARHVDAAYEDVLARSQTDELRSFFVRTDNRGGKPTSGTRSHLHARLDIQKRLGERTTSAINEHQATQRDRQLAATAATIEQDQRAAERSATLANQKRHGELTQSLIDFHDNS